MMLLNMQRVHWFYMYKRMIACPFVHLFVSHQCMDNKDLELGYKVQSLVEHGENWRLLGDSYQQMVF